MFKNIPKGKKSIGKPRNRWLDDVENDLKKMGAGGWRKTSRCRDAWKLIARRPGSCMDRKGSGEE